MWFAATGIIGNAASGIDVQALPPDGVVTIVRG
jgi:hypothetical protein